MRIHILLFGQLTDVIGIDKIIMEDISDTATMTIKLHQQFPKLANFKYLIAVDKNIISSNTILRDACEVALLPPFSGG